MAFVKSISESEEGVSAVMTRFPDQEAPLLQLADVLMCSGDCEFTVEQRELIFAYAAGVNDCTYCYDTHKATAEAVGIDAGLLDAMVKDLESSPVDDRLKPILRFVRKLTQAPENMLQTDVDEILDAGWDEKCFHFAVMICGMSNMMSRLIEGSGITSTAEVRNSRGRLLATAGYLPR
jgi:AhpD family alkylhydroperoxidase